MSENTKQLNIRLQLKYDSYENWTTNNPKLYLGEIAVVYISENTTINISDHSLAGTTPPQILFKVGDGINRFNDLKYTSGLAADVNDYAKLTNDVFETSIKNLASLELSEDIAKNASSITDIMNLLTWGEF